MIIALSGGVGGAKLALGLARVMPPEELVVVVNTGDDFEHLGLSISPDIDTVAYTLAGLANRELGWMPRESLQTGLSRTVDWYLDLPDWTLDDATAPDRLGLGASRKHPTRG